MIFDVVPVHGGYQVVKRVNGRQYPVVTFHAKRWGKRAALQRAQEYAWRENELLGCIRRTILECESNR